MDYTYNQLHNISFGEPVSSHLDAPRATLKNDLITKIALGVLIADAALFLIAPISFTATVIVIEVCALSIIGLFKLIHYLADLQEQSESSPESGLAELELEETLPETSAEIIEDFRSVHQGRIDIINRLIEGATIETEEGKRRLISTVNSLIQGFENTQNANRDLYEQNYGPLEELEEYSAWLENQIAICRENLNNKIN